MSLADTISTASAFAARTGQEIHGNGEMTGIGAANLAAGLFQGFPVSTSASRTAVAERSGAKTQLTGVTGAALIILMIVLVPGLFRNLPQPALAAVVITASLSPADIPATTRLWRQRKAEFLLSIAAFGAVALLGVLPGIAIAVGVSILNVFRRAWWPYDTELGRVETLEGYHDVHMHPEAQHLPGLVIYRFDAPLFFANAKTFRDEVRRFARTDPPPTWIVVAAEPMTDVDTTASDVLEELDSSLNAQGIALVFARPAWGACPCHPGSRSGWSQSPGRSVVTGWGRRLGSRPGARSGSDHSNISAVKESSGREPNGEPTTADAGLRQATFSRCQCS